jgi:hypothetical protein
MQVHAAERKRILRPKLGTGQCSFVNATLEVEIPRNLCIQCENYEFLLEHDSLLFLAAHRAFVYNAKDLKSREEMSHKHLVII